MGYESELHCREPIFVYPMGWSQDEFVKRILRAVNNREIRGHSQFENLADVGESDLVESLGDMFYTFEYDANTGSVLFTPSDFEFYAKHQVDDILAVLLSLLIPIGQRTWLEFIGEDMCRWGWAIGHGEILDIHYEETVHTHKGKMRLFDWVEGMPSKTPPEEVKHYRKLNIKHGG